MEMEKKREKANNCRLQTAGQQINRTIRFSSCFALVAKKKKK